MEKKRDVKDVLRETKDGRRNALQRRGRGTGCQLVFAQKVRISHPVGSL